MKANFVLDTRGLFCPVPIIKASEAMINLDSGSILEVLSDDPAIEFDMPAWCKSMGHRIVSMVEEKGVFRFLIVKK